MENSSLITDIASLTGVNQRILNKLIEKITLCIGSIIHDAKQLNEQLVKINIGIGDLVIELSSMQCKFVPSKELKKEIKESLISPRDKLELKLEQELSDRLEALIDGAL